MKKRRRPESEEMMKINHKLVHKVKIDELIYLASSLWDEVF